jgi:hypothetical protein
MLRLNLQALTPLSKFKIAQQHKYLLLKLGILKADRKASHASSVPFLTLIYNKYHNILK